jgi:nucleoside-diphosphate-sugar epimerase
MSRIFVAGATGTLGRPLVRALVSQGHEISGTTRSADRAGVITALGATPVIVDALDGDALVRAVAGAHPEIVVHMLTALPAAGVLRASDLDATNRLREEGTRHLVRAALEAGARRIVAESFIAASGGPNPAKGALESLEGQLADASGRIDTVALRFGLLYGSTVPSTRAMVDRLRARRLFVPGGHEGLVSFLHLEDAVSATLAAIAHATPASLYSVADDEPVSLRAFIRALASALGMAEPRALPLWLVRLAAPMVAEFAAARMTLNHDGLTRDFGWRPAYPSVREGIAEVARTHSTHSTHSTHPTP